MSYLWETQGIPEKIWLVQNLFQIDGIAGGDSRCDKVQLVRGKRYGGCGPYSRHAD